MLVFNNKTALKILSKSVKISDKKISTQWMILIAGMVLFVIKIIAFIITDSVSILSDALESTINVVTGFVTLKSIQYAAKPRDEDHPYGHGKIEHLTAAIEGILILVAGIIIVTEAILRIGNPVVLSKMDLGILLIAFTGLVNFVLGKYSHHVGKATHSMALQAGGKHLIADTYTTLALVGGLMIYHVTGLYWIDSVLAVIFGSFIIYAGIKVIIKTAQGLMDEADLNKLEELSSVLQSERKKSWVNVHKLTYLKFGHVAHIDLHLTLPWYYNLVQVKDEVDELKNLIIQRIDEEDVDISVQSEPCQSSMCYLCSLECSERKSPFVRQELWTKTHVTGTNIFRKK